LLERADDVVLDALALVVALAARGFEALEPLLALGDGGGAGDDARLLGGEGDLATGDFVFASLQLALVLVRLFLRGVARVEQLLLGVGLGARGGANRRHFGRQRLLAQPRVEQPAPAHQSKGATAQYQGRAYIKEK